jgi:hypothetical protein
MPGEKNCLHPVSAYSLVEDTCRSTRPGSLRQKSPGESGGVVVAGRCLYRARLSYGTRARSKAPSACCAASVRLPEQSLTFAHQCSAEEPGQIQRRVQDLRDMGAIWQRSAHHAATAYPVYARRQAAERLLLPYHVPNTPGDIQRRLVAILPAAVRPLILWERQEPMKSGILPFDDRPGPYVRFQPGGDPGTRERPCGLSPFALFNAFLFSLTLSLCYS